MFKKFLVLLLLLIIILNYVKSEDLPTLYQYYTSGGINSGLSAEGDTFTLNGKQITLLSGSLHYFRVPHQYWNDRLRKFKAAGLNAVQFIMAWNLHEETPGKFDFETGYLNLSAFLQAIKDADMFAIIRPGPYTCGELEFGGFPPWLLRDRHMNLRSNYRPYLTAAQSYFAKLLKIVNEYQFSVNGGPIIALQLENEFGGIHNQNTLEYMSFLKSAVQNSGFKELLFTCDPGSKAQYNPIKDYPEFSRDVLETINLGQHALPLLREMKKNQPNKPLYVSEFWTSWFDQWGDDKHHTKSVAEVEKELTDILFTANASINFYMFHGGTNFGFMNGGHVVTSYDYDAPLTESGNYSQKYWKIKELISDYATTRNMPEIRAIDTPIASTAVNYGVVNVTKYLSYKDFLRHIKPLVYEMPKQMEELDIGSNYGQNYGFILYRTLIPKINELTLDGGLCDRGIILIDNKVVSIVQNSSAEDYSITIDSDYFANTTTTGLYTLDILVENTGRVNGGHMNNERKGLNGNVTVDGSVHTNWTIYPLEFREQFLNDINLNASEWKSYDTSEMPALFYASFAITGAPKDTFLSFDKWVKGSAFVNGFNVGRYWNIGPQKSLFIPAPFLKAGLNIILLFELHNSSDSIELIDKLVWS